MELQTTDFSFAELVRLAEADPTKEIQVLRVIRHVGTPGQMLQQFTAPGMYLDREGSTVPGCTTITEMRRQIQVWK